MDLIQAALAKGQSTLSEYEAKEFLAGFGIPVTREVLARDGDSAAQHAAEMGFPIVLKASGAKLVHKTEVGGVVLNLKPPRM